MARIFNLPQESGLLVQRVVKVSPFGILGIQDGDTEITINNEKIIVGGDVILSINDVKFEFTDEGLLNISNVIGQSEEKKPLQIKVLRGGKIVMLGRK